MKRLIFTYLIVFAHAFPLFSQTSIQHMDPPNWWIGMKTNEIQLLVYGEKISTYKPAISYEGVELQQYVSVQSPNYLFLDIHISDAAQPGDVPITFSQNGKVAMTQNWPLLAREADRAEIKGFDNSDAIYLITPDRFANGDPANDNVEGMRERVDRKNKGGRHGGDLEGIRQHLDYIQDLGFTAVWVNPVLENDMETYSYHGYSTTDFYKVDPRYGTNAFYKQVADEAREKGMGLIMDMIVNHCGSEHWWMKDLPTEDFINQWPSPTYTNHQKSLSQDPYASPMEKKVFLDGWFVETMPDLNQRNPLMATYLIQNGIWWVEYLGLAGIRMDTYPYPDHQYMADWTAALMHEYPNFNIVGEEWTESPAQVAYWQQGKWNPNGYTSALKSVMDFPLQAVFSKSLNADDVGEMRKVYELVALDYLYANPMDLVIFPDNHDMSRIFTQLNEDVALNKIALAYYATMRGIPQYYYGTEILMKNPGTTDHGIIRSDFPGGWAGDKVNAFTGEGLSDEQKDTKAYLKKLLTWRKNAKVIHTGKMMHYIPKAGVYVYFRYNETDKVMVILNKNEKALELPCSYFAEMIQDSTSGKDVVTGTSYSLEGKLKVDGKTALVLELE